MLFKDWLKAEELSDGCSVISPKRGFAHYVCENGHPLFAHKDSEDGKIWCLSCARLPEGVTDPSKAAFPIFELRAKSLEITFEVFLRLKFLETNHGEAEDKALRDWRAICTRVGGTEVSLPPVGAVSLDSKCRAQDLGQWLEKSFFYILFGQERYFGKYRESSEKPPESADV